MSSVELPVCRTQFVHSVFHPCAYQDQTLSHTLTFYLTQTLFFLICKVHPAPNSSPPVLPVSVGVKLAIKFFFLEWGFVLSLQSVEVFYWCGEKQWGQGRALWWQKCIFNPCEWMAPHIPQQQALYWMAALTRLFSLLITALCLFTMYRVIYLHHTGGGLNTIQALVYSRFSELDMG